MFEIRKRVFLKSPVREICTPGSVRGVPSNRRLYRDGFLHVRRSLPGRPEESHHQPPTEPCVNLSAYTARISHSFAASRLQNDADSRMFLPGSRLTKLSLN